MPSMTMVRILHSCLDNLDADYRIIVFRNLCYGNGPEEFEPLACIGNGTSPDGRHIKHAAKQVHPFHHATTPTPTFQQTKDPLNTKHPPTTQRSSPSYLPTNPPSPSLPLPPPPPSNLPTNPLPPLHPPRNNLIHPPNPLRTRLDLKPLPMRPPTNPTRPLRAPIRQLHVHQPFDARGVWDFARYSLRRRRRRRRR